MSKILITGGAGFVGSHCAEFLLKEGHKVLIVDNLQGGYRENIPDGADFIQADVADGVRMDAIFFNFSPEYVFHAAAFAAENLSNFVPAYTANNICAGTSNIVAGCVNAGTKLLVNFSSIAVYGHQEPPFNEEIEPKPMDAYGAAKAYTEALMRAAKHTFGLDSITFRPHNIVGKNQNLSDQYRNVASIFIRQALQGEALTVFGDGEQTRAFSPIGQITPILCSSIHKPETRNEVYNIGADRAYTVNELAEIVSRQAMVPFRVKHLPERKEAKHAYSDHTKLYNAFGKPPYTDIEETIAEMIHEARKQSIRPIQKGPRIEIEKNLPEIWK